MQRLETSVPGFCELRPKLFMDDRGFFMETYHREKFEQFGISESFVQDNHSRSSRGALRGLHCQLRRPQAKVCRVAEGEALDIAVDIRLGSPNFGKWASVLLSTRDHNQVYVPGGFAHGFLALSETVQFLYKCSEFYDPSDEHGIAWHDPDMNIHWGVQNPRVSEKDSRYMRLADVPAEFLPRYGQQ